MAQPWDQLQSESETQYLQFLTYRNQGPTRTKLRSYLEYLELLESPTDGIAKVPGSWAEMMARNAWVDRAQSWDIANVQRYGARVAPAYVTMLETMARKGAEAAEKYEPGQKQWESVVRTAEAVGRLLEPTRAEALPQGFEPTESTHDDAKRAIAAVEKRRIPDEERLLSVK